MILSVSSSSACVSAVNELMLWLMWLPPVVISVVVLFAVLQVLIEYPVALVPKYLHPPSDWPKMCVCVCPVVVFRGCVGRRLLGGP